MKIVGGRFALAWYLPITPDLASTVIFFGDDPERIDYDSPSQEVPAPDMIYRYPEDADGFLPPAAGDKTFVMLACKDIMGNLSDLTEALIVPFDTTPPDAPLNPHLV
jgi:hypothetical protein